MPTVGQRYKDPRTGQEYEYLSGDMWNPVSATYGGRSGGGGGAVSSFQLGYQEPATVPVSNPTPSSTPNINSGTGVANPATPAKPAKTVVRTETLEGGKVKTYYSDGTVAIKNPGRAQGATVAAPAAPGPGGAPAGPQQQTGQSAQVGGTTGISTRPTYKEGDTRGQGAEIFKNGQWVPNTPPPPANTNTGPLPSSVTPDEPLIAPQNDANPISNANALRRAVEAEFPQFNYTAEDIAREARGLGLDQYIPTQEDINAAVDLFGQQADQDYQNADFDLRNRYGGAGIGGQRVLSSGRLAQGYALGKAQGKQNLRNQMLGEGYQRALGKLGMGQGVLSDRQRQTEGRYGTALSAALNQNALQVGATQAERQLAHDAEQKDIQRRHESATAQSTANQQGRAAIMAAILPSLIKATFPEGETPEDAYYKAATDKILKEAGIDPTQFAGQGGDDWLSAILNPANWLNQ